MLGAPASSSIEVGFGVVAVDPDEAGDEGLAPQAATSMDAMRVGRYMINAFRSTKHRSAGASGAR